MKKLLLISILLLSLHANAQWSLTNCPVSEAISFTTNDTTLFAATGYGGGFYASQDSGQTWSAPFVFPTGEYIVSVYNADGYLFLGGSIGNFRSADGGSSWNQMNTLTIESHCYLKVGSNIFAGTYGGGVYKSSDSGNSWSQSNNGLFNSYVYALSHDQSSIYAATASGLFKSTNMGGNWLDVTISIGSPTFDAVTFDGTYIIAGGFSCGLYRSADGGATWVSANTGLSTMDIRALYTIGETIFLGCAKGSFYSIDHGATWVEYNLGFSNSYYIQSYGVIGSTLLCGTYSNGIWKRELTNTLKIPESLESSISIYPNPTNGEFSISLPTINEEITITNILGTEIFKTKTTENRTIFQINENGVYLIYIKTAQGIKTRKLIVSHP